MTKETIQELEYILREQQSMLNAFVTNLAQVSRQLREVTDLLDEVKYASEYQTNLTQ